MSKILIHVDTTEKTHPESSADCYAQGDALARQNRYSEALAQFDRAIELQPMYHEAWVFRGVVLIHLERYQEALASCDRAIKLRPTYTEAWIFRGAALHQLGDYRAAYASYERALGEAHSSPFGSFLNWVKQAWAVLL